MKLCISLQVHLQLTLIVIFIHIYIIIVDINEENEEVPFEVDVPGSTCPVITVWNWSREITMKIVLLL